MQLWEGGHKRICATKQGGALGAGRTEDGALAEAVADESGAGLESMGVEVEFAEIEEVRSDGRVRTARREGRRGAGTGGAELGVPCCYGNLAWR